jgi:protein-disulfide isomerase
MKKSTWAALVLLLGLGAGALCTGAMAADPRGDFEIKPADRMLGSRNAKVVLIEYASFTCSHCAAFHEEVVPELKKNYIDTGKVLFVLRLFPRNLEDALAEKMARCAPAARYFAIADRLFRDQAQWAIGGKAREELVKIGQGFGLAPAAINRCMESTADDARINAVAEEAEKRYLLGGTPHIVINGKPPQDSGGIPYSSLAKMLDQAAAK